MRNENPGTFLQTDDEFLLACIHDIRLHLRKSLTSAQMLERQISNSLPHDARANLDGVLASNRDIEMLLTRLAQYAAAGSMAAGKSSAKLGIIFDSAIRRLADRNRDANIDAQALYMCPIIAPYSCEIVLRELLDNALKFRQGRVQINIRVEQSPDKTVLGISDTGIGFDPQFCEKIMRPLERLHSADTYPGCGLGLAICQRTVHSWGGSLWAESQPGSGSTFWFDLPL